MLFNEGTLASLCPWGTGELAAFTFDSLAVKIRPEVFGLVAGEGQGLGEGVDEMFRERLEVECLGQRGAIDRTL